MNQGVYGIPPYPRLFSVSSVPSVAHISFADPEDTTLSKTPKSWHPTLKSWSRLFSSYSPQFDFVVGRQLDEFAKNSAWKSGEFCGASLTSGAGINTSPPARDEIDPTTRHRRAASRTFSRDW